MGILQATQWWKRVLCGGVVVLMGLALLAASLLWLGEHKRRRVLVLDVAPVPYATDAAAVDRGSYLYLARGCVACHGADGAGRVFIDAPNGLFARAANLTTGAGSAVARYTERDWVRSIRHGVSPEGRALFPMPSEDYSRMSDEDLAQLVAYVRSLPAQDSGPAKLRLPLPVKLAYGAGLVQDAAAKIDHTLAPPSRVERSPSVAYGRYLAQMCMGCHGATLKGGAIPGAPPEWPPAANIGSSPDGVMQRYASLSEFKTVMRTAVRPDGTKVSPMMPVRTLKNTDDLDLEALYLFLRSPESAALAGGSVVR